MVRRKPLTEAEKEHITKMLKSAKGNKTRTAELLGISRKTLWEKIKLFDIEKNIKVKEGIVKLFTEYVIEFGILGYFGDQFVGAALV